MNTCLSNIYLKFAKFDARYVRFALVIITLVASGRFVIMGLPMPGDVSG
jgi:hypothetical protein